MAYRRGVSVATISEISGRDQTEVKESIVKEGDKMSDEQRQSDDATPIEADRDAQSVPVSPPDVRDDAAQSDDSGSDDLPGGTPDLSAYSDAELVERAGALRQAGATDEAAPYDREIAEREDKRED